MKAGTVMTVKDIYDCINGIAPFVECAQWDNTGILAGSPDKTVTKAIVSLDVTSYEVSLAVKENAELIISHHPLIFKPLKNILSDSVCYRIAANGLSVISAHTNFDKAAGGVNDLLCEAIGVPYTKIQGVADGFLNVCELEKAVDAASFAKLLSEKLVAAVRFSDCGKNVSKIAVCSGAGSDFINDAQMMGCDAFLTGDASYHDFLNAVDNGISLFAAGHFETENIAMSVLTDRLNNTLKDVNFIFSDRLCPVKTVM